MRISICPTGRFLMWSSRARVSLMSLSLPVPIWSSPDVQMGVASALAVIHHENLHLPYRQVLNVVLAGTGLFDVALATCSDLELAGRANGSSECPRGYPP